MAARLEFLPAYIIHTRPYRDTSVLVDFFTEKLGRVTAVARGVRQQKNRTRALLNPFTRLLVSLHGKNDLKLLTAIESDSRFFTLQGEYLYSGFYINELLLRLLPEMDEYPGVFETYQRTLIALQKGHSLESILRSFELDLLADIGYGLDCGADIDTGESIDAGQMYIFAQQGFRLQKAFSPQGNCISGVAVKSIADRDFSDPAVRLAAKYICRQMLKPLLGSRPLNSRALFVSSKP